MLPNGELILYELKKRWTVIVPENSSLPERLLPPLLWKPCEIIQPGHLYLTDDPQSAGKELLCPFLCCGHEPIPESSMISLPDAGLWDVFNCIQSLYAGLERWEESLAIIAEQNSSLQTLLDTASAYMGNLLVITSAGLETICSSEHGHSHHPSDEKWDRKLNISDLSFMKEQMALVREKAGVQWIRKPLWEYEFLYANLLDGRAKLGTIALLPTEHALSLRDVCLLKVLLVYAQRMMQKRIRSSEFYASLHRGLQLLLSGGSPEKEKLDYWIAAAGFEPGDNYICLVIPMPKEVFTEYQGILRRFILEQQPLAVLFPWECDLVVILNQNCSVDLPSFYLWLEDQLKQADLTAGISESFTDLMSLRSYYIQAKVSTQLNGKRLNHFDQCRSHYILHHCCGELSPDFLYTPGFRRVLDHTAHSTVDYIETLRIWLEEAGNESRAAARLYVCRNTFMYRKKQLDTLLGDEMNSSDGRFLLMLCLRLWDMHSAEKQNAE